MKISIRITILSLAGVLLFNGCGQEFLDRKPLSQLSTDAFYKTAADAKAAILAVYSVLQGPRFYGESYYYVMELASDDATHKNLPYPIDEFNWSPIQGNTGSERFEHLWALYYEGILRANIVLEKVPTISMDETEKKKIMAEAYFLRGLYYWHLAITFGDAPIYTAPIKAIEEVYIAKSPRSEVYKRAEDDLKLAETDLPEQWTGGDKGRADKFAAKAFLGKVYLYQQKWGEAKTKLEEVISSNKFRLLDDFKSIFSLGNENNAESIFEIQYADRGSGSNNYFTDGGVAGEGTKRDLILGIQGAGGQQGYGEIIGTKDLFREFEFGDRRMNETVYFVRYDRRPPYDLLSGYTKSGISDSTFQYLPSTARLPKTGGNEIGEYYHIKKAVNGFTGASGVINSPNNWRMMRYADVLLMAAEAINEENGGPTATAIGYLNQVRGRAKALNNLDVVSLTGEFGVGSIEEPFTSPGLNLFPYAAYIYNELAENGGPKQLSPTKEDFRWAIVHERRVELAFEYHRFPDMKRWEEVDPNHPGAAQHVFRDLKTTVEDRKPYNPAIHSRCPIPQYQIDLEKGILVQNPGY